ncbi:hypothetical protein FRC07_006059, partial [Ceratobasidium sp. 392]
MYARQVQPGAGEELRVYFSPEAESLIFGSRSSNSTQPTPKAAPGEIGYVQHIARDSADVAVEDYRSKSTPGSPGSEVTFTLSMAKRYQEAATLEHRTQAGKKEVDRVLLAAARWHWHMRRGKSSTGSKSRVSLEFMKLGVLRGEHIVSSEGQSKNLINEKGVAEIKVKQEDQYGIKILNQRDDELYVRVFYFSASDFSVLDMFGHNKANGRSDPDVPKRGQRIIGDNADGGSLLSFALEPGQRLELGYIKVFWSTNPLELDDVAQGSPFDGAHQEVDIFNTSLNSKPKSRLHALVIGINRYEKLHPLTGAVADADAVEGFLADNLKVPHDQMVNLRNGFASREAIIRGLQNLQENPRIQKGDPIVIFYAGHGGLGQAQQEWKREYGYDEIQVIFPCDYGTEVPGSKETVNCIPDRTVRVLLNQLAAAKGNNITVIFDCCFSASGSRSDDTNNTTSSQVARDANVSVDVPYNIDANIIPPSSQIMGTLHRNLVGPRGPKLPLYTDQASHIHLAACGSEEKAWEEAGRGVFTTTLLSCIQASGINKITYQSLLDSLPKLQNTTLIPVKHEHGTWILQAGVASGVTKGSVWKLYGQATEDSQPLGLLHAHTPKVSSTVLDVDPKQSMALAQMGVDDLYARLVRPGTGQELRVYFSPEAKRLVFPPGCDDEMLDAETSKEYDIGYVIHPSSGSADLIVDVCQQTDLTSKSYRPDVWPEVEFTLRNPQAEKYGVAKLKRKTQARRGEVEAVLFAAARWNWHLNRTNQSRARPMVSLGLVKLGTMYGDYMMPVEEPWEDLNKGGVVDIRVKEEDQYGIRLSSQVPAALYVRAFYFDASNFSILDMFGHSRANGRSDPDIPAHGQLIIGDGSNGGALLSFGLTPDTELEMGFVKVFWSTDPLELDDVAQEPGFMSCPHGEANGRK